MAQQNIYDNETFFEGYKKIRENQVNVNNLFEIPALFSLMPELERKRVLDLGCGFGKLIEPLPTNELLEKYPNYKDLFHKPDFLLIKVKK